jgi:hypothetical protein
MSTDGWLAAAWRLLGRRTPNFTRPCTNTASLADLIADWKTRPERDPDPVLAEAPALVRLDQRAAGQLDIPAAAIAAGHPALGLDGVCPAHALSPALVSSAQGRAPGTLVASSGPSGTICGAVGISRSHAAVLRLYPTGIGASASGTGWQARQ